jgi:hypothetical protein
MNQNGYRTCEKHNIDGTTINPLCSTEGCKVHPSFIETETKILACSKHKTSTMKYRYKSCADSECQRQPRYNLPGLKPMYCYLHKIPGSIFVGKKPINMEKWMESILTP